MSSKQIITISIIIIIIFLVLIIIIYSWVIEDAKNGGEKINSFLEGYCNDGPILDPKDFSWTKDFRENQKEIKKEFLEYSKKYIIPNYTDISEELSAKTVGWKSLFLRVFNKDIEIIDKFPITKKLINSCSCTTAYFSKLEPRTRIPKHRGIYKGVIRYHLSIIIPKKWEDCFIIVDGNKLHWKEGSKDNIDLAFDDMYLHEVQNNTDEERVVLFLDIRRNFNNIFVNMINVLLLTFIKSNDMVINTVNKANNLNKIKHKKRNKDQ